MGLTNRIHDTNLLKKKKIRNKTQKQVIECSKKLYSSQYTMGMMFQIEYILRIVLLNREKNITIKMGKWTNLLKTLRIHDPRYESNPDSFCKARIKPFWSQDLWPRIDTSPWIHETNPRAHNSLIRFQQP